MILSSLPWRCGKGYGVGCWCGSILRGGVACWWAPLLDLCLCPPPSLCKKKRAWYTTHARRRRAPASALLLAEVKKKKKKKSTNCNVNKLNSRTKPMQASYRLYHFSSTSLLLLWCGGGARSEKQEEGLMVVVCLCLLSYRYCTGKQ